MPVILAQGAFFSCLSLHTNRDGIAKEGAAQNRTSITNQPPGVGKVEMGFFAPLLGISINTTALSVSNNGLFSLTMIGLLKAAEASSKLLTANQSATHRYTTIEMASPLPPPSLIYSTGTFRSRMPSMVAQRIVRQLISVVNTSI
jgi:hypothetical protein